MDDKEVQGTYNYRKLSQWIATAGQPTEEELVAVVRAGYRVVINLGLHDGAYALPDERGLVQSLGLDYIHIPVAWERPTKADFGRFLEVMDACKGKSLFVHCAANKRVSAFMALYRVVRLGWPVERALEDMRGLQFPEPWQQFMDDVLNDSAGSAGWLGVL